MARRIATVTAVTPAAATAGLAPGQAVADAQAMLPTLHLLPAAPEADAAWLRDLALWCLALTPLPAPDPPAGLLLDVTGIDHLHGGEARFARRLLRLLAAARRGRHIGQRGMLLQRHLGDDARLAFRQPLGT